MTEFDGPSRRPFENPLPLVREEIVQECITEALELGLEPTAQRLIVENNGLSFIVKTVGANIEEVSGDPNSQTMHLTGFMFAYSLLAKSGEIPIGAISGHWTEALGETEEERFGFEQIENHEDIVWSSMRRGVFLSNVDPVLFSALESLIARENTLRFYSPYVVMGAYTAFNALSNQANIDKLNDQLG